MHLIWTLIIGLLAGLVARFILPGRQQMGWILTMLLGIGGAFLATWGGQLLGLYQAGRPAGFIGAVVGALIILVIYERVVAKK